MWTWCWRMERLHVSQGKGRADGKGSPWWLVRGGGGTHPFPSGDRNTEGVHSISQILPRQKGPTCSPLHLQPGPETANQIKKQTKSGRTPLVEREEDGGVYCAIFGVPIIKVGSGLCFASVLGDRIFKWAAHKELRGRWRTSRANHSQKTWDCFERVA